MTPEEARAALDRLAEGGKPALARAIAGIEAKAKDPATAALLDAALERQGAHVVGLTGPPGVGKSTLTDALIRGWRADGLSVGVVAIDPSSRRSGGALLGARTRVMRDPADQGVFFRSMAARDRLGGIAELTFPAVVLMGALMDRVVVETVGVGQSETDVDGVADTVVLCAQPGAGDTLQAMKAGVLEIPDIVVVTKADMGEPARRTVSDMTSAMALVAPDGGAEVLSLSARDGDGLDAFRARIEARATARHPAERIAARRTQARGWTRLAVAAEFGRHGLRAFDAVADDGRGAPFAAGAWLMATLSAALDRPIALGRADDPRD
ncbi:MAG: ArgK/MeaB family GTPase [Paracoccaceae bacterium]